MTQKDTGGPAFPLQPASEPSAHYLGMTLRDYFAGQAIQGFDMEYGDDYISQRAYEIADAMIAARKENT